MKTIIICRPDINALKYANSNTKLFLFKEQVDIERVKEQYFFFKNILKKEKQQFIDIYDYIPRNISYEEYTNLLFVRDVFIRTDKGIILGNMKESVRKTETSIMATILKSFDLPIIYQCTDSEILEGGDFCIHNDIAFIATGTRTNLNAAKKLLDLNLYGTKKVAIIFSSYRDDDMHRIHLDCYFSPFRYKQCVLWEELIRTQSNFEKMVIEYIQQDDGTYIQTTQPIRLYEFLINNKYDVIPLSTKSHYNYGCNILELNNGKILVQDEESYKKITNSIYIEFDEIHRMYGGLHCASNTF